MNGAGEQKKQEQPLALRIECALGGQYDMPDGRGFWIDKAVAVEMTRRVLNVLLLADGVDVLVPTQLAQPSSELIEKALLLQAEAPRARKPGQSAAADALDEIAALLGCPHWDYPGQVVRDVKLLKALLLELRPGAGLGPR